MLFDVALVVQNIDIRCQRAGGDDSAAAGA
ncbi:Uncharacterised protein [Vibrio cholerae]|nr:Uncharacterised protein [Vibrio cholerae]